MQAPERLADVLVPFADLLDGARFIGRASIEPETSEHDESRWYPDPWGEGRRYQSVTWTIGSTESAPWLPQWAAKLAAELVIDNWSALGGMMRAVGPTPVLAWLKAEAKYQRELAADCGTWHHDVLESILLDRAIPDPPAHIIGRRLTTGGENILISQETLDRWADGILAFLTDYRLTPVMSEATVYHRREGYAARIDLGAEVPGYGTLLVDMKSGAPRASVIAQLTAQRYATHVVLPGGALAEMPRFEHAAVLHLRQVWERGYKLRPIPTGLRQWAWFRACNRLLQEREAQAGIDNSVMYPPTFSLDGSVIDIPKVPMIEDSGLRCRKALRAAGFTWLHELSGFEARDLQSDTKRSAGIRGVGPAAIDDIRRVLGEHGLTLADDAKGAAA